MNQIFLGLKDSSNLKENLLITAIKLPDNSYNVEVWNPQKDYHSLKPLENDMKEAEKEIKNCIDLEKKNYYEYCLYFKKYNNKRYNMQEEELLTKFYKLKGL